MRNFFFGFSALALLLAGCDDGTSDPNDVGSGNLDATLASKPDATLALKPDAVPPGPITCPIPVATVKSFGTKVGTVPSSGYRLLIDPEHFTCSTFAGYAGPTDCKSPVNGFASTASDPWCCVNTVPNTSGDRRSAVSAYMNVPSLQCSSLSYFPDMAKTVAGKVALCSVDGKFMGWDCNS